ncbi:xanthine dehydrogenase family protein molybdopterin-binding subunit [Cryptosporangium arvum]|uniref:Aerobic-type carbon monoxide dehydrogenase, large subunit CoxL/CutL-like protein n=1 Tax=Cryptosporangium arvum DSM 44712 TaxID=927661 RepID=A0A010YXD7_9ACTN|nr:xanthine dehydrogenase family protein molybdopterin-binding subunit [Cryptosporangium arvum]EXG79833.1 aerobic-type carbon monoxide dehydrogenase, large subunit CoxL/CutL-like protein [Cryptosporangium arvum DSM 44712]
MTLSPTRPGAIGTPVARVEGPLKVTGTARYAVEYPVENVVYAWIVQSPVARGTLTAIDAPESGDVLTTLWHGNAPKLSEADDPELQVLQSPTISYRGQVVALVVARTLEAARGAAQSVELSIEEEEHDVLLTPDHPRLYTPEKVNPAFPSDTSSGDVEAALADAAATVDVTYETPALHNNPMEPHATTALWVDDDLVLYDSNQGPSAIASQVAKVFGLKKDQVHVVAEHVGGGFGSKGSARPNAILAAMAARVVGHPVRLALPRQALFTMVGHRTPTIQRVRLGATADGVFTAIAHDVVEHTSQLFEFAEQTAVVTRHMYAAPNRRTSHRLARLDVPTPRWMRAPGEAPGMVALECAVDELAASLGLDPIELRIRNEPDAEPEDGTPFSSRHYVECLRLGAARFGWDTRPLRPRQRREGRWWVGTGVAGATYPSMVMPSTATVRIDASRNVLVEVAAVDIGTGSRTVLHQVAADVLGVPLENVTVRIGDSSLPRASIAGGSSGSASWGWAVDGACRKLREEMSRLTGPVPADGLSASFDTGPDVRSRENSGKHAFGAHFAEVRVDADTGEVRVSRLFGQYAVGRVLNPRTARSQFIGGMTMGLGMALHEESVLDVTTGDWVNHDLAEYHVPAHADVEWIDAAWLDEEDSSVNPLGVKGIGEIGIVGSPAAIVNAIWHATGVRVRDLPVRLDKLLTDPAF